jgi:hypothetical protein
MVLSLPRTSETSKIKKNDKFAFPGPFCLHLVILRRTGDFKKANGKLDYDHGMI